MSTTTVLLHRQPLVGLPELERIEEAALRILEQVGIAVRHDALRERLGRLGFRMEGERAVVERWQVAEFLNAERRRNGDEFRKGPREVDATDVQIRFSANEYAHHVHDVESDRIVPFTTERLIEATKLLEAVSDRGIRGGPPGCPADVAPQLQPVVQYWVSATYSRNGRQPPDVRSPADCGYMMEMADALGNPIRRLPVWVTSPLTLAGDSLQCVLDFKERLSSVYVGSMPSLGCTAPINAGDGFALSAAEVVGSAVLLAAALGLPMSWTVGLYPTDFTSMAMVFGSPENTLLALMGSEVDAYLHGSRWSAGGGVALTMAKLPGAQSCAEKASAMTAGALLGQRVFSAPGALSLDEVFSPEQLLYDLEIKDHVERLIRGLDAACDPDRCLDEVVETLQERSFAGLESTARTCRHFWRPQLFERSFLSTWLNGGRPTSRARARLLIRDLLSRHDYELDREVQRELDGILSRARAELA